MSTAPIDYDSLAKQHGGGVDYDALASAHGGGEAQAATEPKSFGQGLWDSTVGGLGRAIKHYGIDLPQQHADEIQQKWQAGDHLGAIAAAVKAGGLGPGTNLLKDTAKGQFDQFEKAADALTSPDGGSMGDRISAAMGHTAAGLVPVIGPAAAHVGEDLGEGLASGHPGYALGEAAGLLAPFAASKAADFIPKTAVIKSPTLKPVLDGSEQAAVDFGRANNVPIDAATATGSPAIRNIQGALQNAPGAAASMKRARMAQTDALKHVGGELADQVSDIHTDPELAGGSVQSELSKSRIGLAQQKTSAYSRLEEMERDPQNAASVPSGNRQVVTRGPNGSVTGVQNVPATQKIAAPVYLEEAKKALSPIRDALMQELPPSQQGYSQALNAINGVLDGPNAIPASAADQTLSAIKRIQRESKNPKTIALAGRVIDALSPQVDAAVAKMGPTAVQALQDGRSFTKAQMAVEATEETQPSEPVRLVDALTKPRDTSINLLSDVARKAPGSIPAIGRSVIDGLIQEAFSEAGTAKPGTALTKWQKIGDSTKNILFKSEKNPGLITDLDNFFTLSKKVAENPNPSGSAYVGMLMGDGAFLVSAPHYAIPYMIGRTAVARLLSSPGGARALTEGMRVPIASNAKNALVAGRILQLAGKDAQPSASAAQ